MPLHRLSIKVQTCPQHWSPSTHWWLYVVSLYPRPFLSSLLLHLSALYDWHPKVHDPEIALSLKPDIFSLFLFLWVVPLYPVVQLCLLHHHHSCIADSAPTDLLMLCPSSNNYATLQQTCPEPPVALPSSEVKTLAILQGFPWLGSSASRPRPPHISFLSFTMLVLPSMDLVRVYTYS